MVVDAGQQPTADDAATDAIAPTPMNDPAAKGSYTVTDKPTTEVTRGTRRIPVLARVPTGATATPLVVLLPGFQLESSRYAGLAKHLVSHGMVVVSADPPASLLSVSHVELDLDVSAVIDWALGAGLGVDPTKIATLGHSLGGKISVMTAARDPRVKAAFAVDPVNGGGGFGSYTPDRPNIVPDKVAPLRIPLGFIGETTNASGGVGGMSCAPAAQNFETFFAAASNAPWVAKWDFAGADHMDFLDTTGCGFTCSACTQGTADASVVQSSTQTIAAAFFLRHFFGQAGAEVWLTGTKVPTGVTATKK
jgi:pimeloyl-ACP methyl ester carboxylesterase